MRRNLRGQYLRICENWFTRHVRRIFGDMNNDLFAFLEKIATSLKKLGINIAKYKIDHVAYGVTSPQVYDQMLPTFLHNGELVREATIDGRRVSIIKYFTPPIWHDQEISAVELIEPKKGEEASLGWEHAEFLVNSYDQLISEYPKLNWDTKHIDRKPFTRVKLKLENGMEVKFLDTPVLISSRE